MIFKESKLRIGSRFNLILLCLSKKEHLSFFGRPQDSSFHWWWIFWLTKNPLIHWFTNYQHKKWKETYKKKSHDVPSLMLTKGKHWSLNPEAMRFPNGAFYETLNASNDFLGCTYISGWMSRMARNVSCKYMYIHIIQYTKRSKSE